MKHTDSMGSRGSWAIVLNQTSPWAAAAMISGDLDPIQLKATSAINKLIRSHLPLRHYHGALDTDSSPQTQYNSTVVAIKRAATRLHKKNPLKGYIVEGIDHGGMQVSCGRMPVAHAPSTCRRSA